MTGCAEHPPLRRQAVRFGLAGLLLASCYAMIFAAAMRAGAVPQAANALAFVANLALGWFLHSRWSFRGLSFPGHGIAAIVRFAAINAGGYALNAFWVYCVATLAKRPPMLAIVPIVTVTPAINFMLNRLLIFKVRD